MVSLLAAGMNMDDVFATMMDQDDDNSALQWAKYLAMNFGRQIFD
jgi:hypothetical protein